MMGISRKNLLNSNSEYTVSYKGMAGVDFTTGGIIKSRSRYAYLENMYRDYDGYGDGITESIPGFRKITSLGEPIHSIYSHTGNDNKEYAVIHAGSHLYRFSMDERDSDPVPKSIFTLENQKSQGFNSGNDLYILDGKKITRVAGNGSVSYISKMSYYPYAPTTFINGKEYEQRNLLNDMFYERYTINSVDEYAYGTPTLHYKILSSTEKTCTVTGIEDNLYEEVFVPSYVNINNEKYKVTEISNKAFYENDFITKLYLSPKTVKIGRLAFGKCTALTKVSCSEETEVIEEMAFKRCTALKNFFIGRNMKKLEAGIFDECQLLTNIRYSMDSEAYNKIEGYENIGEREITYNAIERFGKISLPIFSPAKVIRSVMLDGEYQDFSFYTTDMLMHSVGIEFFNKYECVGKEFIIYGQLSLPHVTKTGTSCDFISPDGEGVNGLDAINGCRICESFDGRIFLSGNPRLPNTVFYSSRNQSGVNDPTYFGALNYFNDGTGSYPVISLLTAGDSLAVFKAGDDGGGSIYYHTAKDTDIDTLPKIYPVSYTHNGISAAGESVSFFDDPLFISHLGITALEKKNINLERSIAVRSHNINARLLTEDLSRISFAKWCGYLVVCADGHIYLADSRAVFNHSSGNSEYEWYFLNGIGTYKTRKRVYRYASLGSGDIGIHEAVDSKVSGDIIESTLTDDGETVFYTVENGKKYAVYPTEEYTGTDFSPAITVFATSDGKLLLFGTESGDICIFNNDKRGEPPPYIAEKEGFDKEGYASEFSGRLHPYYYSFAGHAPRYAARTVMDDCGIPHLTKCTVKHSSVIKIRSFGSGSLVCEAGTDKKGFSEIAVLPASELNFDELSFSSFAFSSSDYLSIPISEKEKNWVEKHYNFYTDEYASPLGICGIAYRFFVKGKIKKT